METFTLTIEAYKEAYTPLPLKRVPCIYYPIRFKKDQTKKEALIHFESKVNNMILAYAASLGLKVWSTNVGA